MDFNLIEGFLQAFAVYFQGQAILCCLVILAQGYDGSLARIGTDSKRTSYNYFKLRR